MIQGNRLSPFAPAATVFRTISSLAVLLYCGAVIELTSLPATADEAAETAGGNEAADYVRTQDSNKDGKIERSEADPRLEAGFDYVDTNKDGYVDVAELEKAAEQAQSGQQPLIVPLEDRSGQKPYSPWVEDGIPRQVFWGDSHLHTAMSYDAGAFGARLGLEDAYRFARGEQVVSSTGQPAKLSRPLDWMVIADHAEFLGIVDDLLRAAPRVTRFEQGARWSEQLRAAGRSATVAAYSVFFEMYQAEPELMANYFPGSEVYASVWDKAVKTADAYNVPGTFTTLIGFEWTAGLEANNLHRNVIFRDDGAKAGQMVPYPSREPFGSSDPLQLYRWMANYEEKTGGRALALAHNGNLSNGLMFPVDAQYTGRKLDAFYVEQRAKWEPMVEITQIKGDGEAHPFLSPDDDFADYGTWDVGNMGLTEAKKPEMLAGEYGREALKNGLLLEARFGTNPYKFGLAGSTDSHTGLASAEEDNFFGKHSPQEPSPGRMSTPFFKSAIGEIATSQVVASGITGIWATENTREAIFDAMSRREVYATTGPRMTVRFFGGWHYTPADLNSRQPESAGYGKGVPMGGDLPEEKDRKAPTFMVYALRDPIGANLDRVQIVKGWLDKGSKTHEKVYDVAWSDSREPDKNGKLPPVGNTVDLKNATWANTIGAAELATVWSDPDFDVEERAFYYARVLEIPTPRWIVYDAFRFGVEIPIDAQTTHQERAYTSPIWYTP